MSEISRRIYNLAYEKYGSISNFIKETEWSKNTVHGWFYNKKYKGMSIDTIIALSEYFEVTTDYILKGVNK